MKIERPYDRKMESISIKEFLEVEKKYDLYHMDIDGINVWEYSRFEIWNYIICTEKLGLQKAHRAGNKVNIGQIFYNFIRSYIKFRFSKQRAVDVCFITHERRIKEHDFYECIYSDALIKEYPNSVVLERPYNYGHLEPIKTPNMYYTDWIIIVGNVHAKLHSVLKTPRYKQVYKKVSEALDGAFQEIKKTYQLETSFDKLVKLNVDKYFMCKRQRKMYIHLLQKFSPKVILEVCHYSRQAMLINEIAKELNIPTIELQHGTMHSEHAAYQYQTDSEIAQLPDEIFMFSEYWKTQIHLPIADDKLIITGFPFFEQKKEHYIGVRKKTDKKIILFISQGTIGKELGLLAVKLSKKIDSSKYRIIYKLHPGEYVGWKETYSELAKADVEVIDNSETNLYAYFAQANVQIGVYSTAIYEGLGFGLKTIIYNIGHANTMASLVEQEYAVFVNDVEDVIAELEKEDVAVKENVFWKQDALVNMKKLLNNRLSEN